MAKVKGSALKASLAFLETKLGRDKTRAVIGKLPDFEKRVLESAILQGSWYEFSILAKLMDAAAPEVILDGPRSLAWEMGRFSADQGLRGLYRIFLHVADPHYVIRKSSQLFSTYYDSGEMMAETAENRRAVLCLRRFNEPGKAFCERLCGFMEKTMELCGCENVSLTHPKCISRGDSHCEFVATWE
jgi:hypothetical protein